MIKIVYITGRGHSGSTVFDALLGNAKAIESVGEFVSGVGKYRTEVCSCGSPMFNCPFWANVINNYKHDYKSFFLQTKQQAHVKKFLSVLFFKHKQNQLIKDTLEFFNSIAEVNNASIVVDSSKEPTRALMLSRSSDVQIVHLVRNPERVIASTYYRIEKGNKVQFLRKKFSINNPVAKFLFLTNLSISWSVGSLLVEIVKMVSKNKVITVKYEDIITNPKGVLKTLESHIGIPLEDLKTMIDKNDSLLVGHNIGGNHFRHDKKFVLDKSKTSHRKLSLFWKVGSISLNFPMMLYYGYNPFSKNG